MQGDDEMNYEQSLWWMAKQLKKIKRDWMETFDRCEVHRQRRLDKDAWRKERSMKFTATEKADEV